MDKVLSLLISVGIIAMGDWVVVADPEGGAFEYEILE